MRYAIMPEAISVKDISEQIWEDFKSPTTSDFDKNMAKCRNSVAQIEEELDTDRSELNKLKKSVRALCNSTNKHAQNEKDIAENLERISHSTSNSNVQINEALQEFARVTKSLGTLIEDLSKSLNNSLQFPLESLLKGDIKEVKGDLRKPFDKSWKDYESKFSKLEKDFKKKWSDANLYRNELTGKDVVEEMEKERKIFQLQLCSYLIKVNEIKTKKGVDLLNSLIEYYKAVKLFFNKGQTEIEKHESFVENLGQRLKEIKQGQHQERSDLQELQTALKSSMTGYKELPTSTVEELPRKKRLYDTGLIARAYKEVVESNMSVYKAARIYGIPESTLRDRKLGLQPVTEENEKLPSCGQSPTFTAEEEKKLSCHIDYMERIGYGCTRAELLNLVFDWAVILGRKKQSDQEFTSSWYSGFKKRNPDVTLTDGQRLSALKAMCTSTVTLNNYFAQLEKVMSEHDLIDHPEFIWNVDETGLLFENSPSNLVNVKGMTIPALTSNRRKTVSVIASGSAAGGRLPPYYIFPGKRWVPDLLNGASTGSNGTVTERGWPNSTVFMKYLEDHFLKHVSTKDHPVMILFDGHKSRVNLTLSEWGEENNIVFFVLPPNTSHIIHPVDVGCFGPLKNIYDSECQAYMSRNPGLKINRYNIAEVSSIAYNRGVYAEKLISSFRKIGVFPLQRRSVAAGKTVPSNISVITDDTDQPVFDNYDDFSESRNILRMVETAKGTRKRKTKSTGNTSPAKKVLVSPLKSKNTSVAKKTLSQVTESSEDNTVSSKKKVASPRNRSNHLSPVPGPSVDSISGTEDSDSDIADEDLCCVCDRFTPESLDLEHTLELVKWGQCDDCGHWTHLKYCTEVKILRKYDEFLCPHCISN